VLASRPRFLFDRIDAGKICDRLRCDFLPESYMASTAIRERRRTLRYRNLLVRQIVQRNAATAVDRGGFVSLNQRPLSSAFLHQALLLRPIHSNLTAAWDHLLVIFCCEA
jgi:hypothetical protein